MLFVICTLPWFFSVYLALLLPLHLSTSALSLFYYNTFLFINLTLCFLLFFFFSILCDSFSSLATTHIISFYIFSIFFSSYFSHYYLHTFSTFFSLLFPFTPNTPLLFLSFLFLLPFFILQPISYPFFHHFPSLLFLPIGFFHPLFTFNSLLNYFYFFSYYRFPISLSFLFLLSSFQISYSPFIFLFYLFSQPPFSFYLSPIYDLFISITRIHF